MDTIADKVLVFRFMWYEFEIFHFENNAQTGIFKVLPDNLSDILNVAPNFKLSHRTVVRHLHRLGQP